MHTVDLRGVSCPTNLVKARLALETIDPGETVQISAVIQNSGSSGAYDVEAAISSPDNFISILTGLQNGGNLADGQITELSFTVSADENKPGGYNAMFYIDITAAHHFLS